MTSNVQSSPGELEEAIFAILCKVRDERQAVATILKRISKLTAARQREALAELSILSGRRGLKALVKEEIKRMPVSIDIHENEFLEEIYQEGLEKGLEKGLESAITTAREMLVEVLEEKFGALPVEIGARIQNAGLVEIRRWMKSTVASSALPQIFA